MAEQWTRAELEAAYPDGTVGTQTDDVFTPYTTDEWSTWIDGQVGTDKPEPDA